MTARRRRAISIGAGLAAAVTVTAAAGIDPNAFAASTARVLTLYAVPSQRQFVDNRDDRSRAQTLNPFGIRSVTTGEAGPGPPPGDTAVFGFDLYADAARTTRAGTGTLVCDFNVDGNASCRANYRLHGGTLVGVGAVNVDASTFTLAVSGGSGRYRGATGNVQAEATGRPTSRLLLKPHRLRIVIGARIGTSGRPAHVLYSVATRQQFVNNADDVALGNLENPFGRSGGPPPRPNERAHGPFPGDETVYTFEVFTDRELTASIGSAVFTCTYSFARTALCDAAYRLRDGQLIGAGTLGFDAPGFTLALTGGTGAYRGSSGELKATSTPGGGQRLRLVLD